jgi:hypothetical protein
MNFDEQLVHANGPNPLHVKQLTSQGKQILEWKQVPTGQKGIH